VKLRTWSFRAQQCRAMDPGGPAEAEMSRQGAHVRGKVGKCIVTLFKLADCYEVLRGLMTTGLDGRSTCAPCRIEHLRGPYTVESDWDDKRGSLKPDSPSLAIGPMAYRVPE
jgi:hypothetical protein